MILSIYDHKTNNHRNSFSGIQHLSLVKESMLINNDIGLSKT